MKNESAQLASRSWTLGLKMVACLLSTLLFLYAVPTNVFAELINAIDTATDSNDEQTAIEETEPGKEGTVFEVTDRREETVKHFRTEDGSFTAVQYNVPVHEKDENGEWQDIDNTLSESGSEYATSNARVKFAKKTTGNVTLFTLHDGNRKISMSLSGAKKKVAGQVTNTQTEFPEDATQLQKMMTLDKLSSKILYPTILDGVDLEYVVNSCNIKENIIVKERADSYSYTFEIQLINLEAVLCEDGSVAISDPDTDEVVYTIPKGYMFDAEGAYSDAVEYTLTNGGNGKYSLTVTADAEWINDEERVLPVTIDPTIEQDNYFGDPTVESTYVASGTVNMFTNYSNDDFLYVGTHPIMGATSTYIKMKDIPVIPDDAAIIEASISMSISSLTNSPVYIGVYRVISSWSIDNITYYNKPNNSSSPIDYKRISTNVPIEWDITSLVNDWYNGTENYGLVLSSFTETTSSKYVKFKSERLISSVPSFKIVYRDTKGVEPYYSYFSSHADMAGSGQVNALTGNLAFIHSSLSTTDEIMPYTVSMTYNSCLGGQYYKSNYVITPIESPSTGMGFKMSYDETIKQINQNEYDELFVWADADGTEHYFSWQDFKVANETVRGLCDEDGLGLYLEPEYNDVANDYSIQGYMLSDEAGNKKHFDSAGYLDYIEDTNGNRRIFVRSTIDHKVESISLSPHMSDDSFMQLQMTYSPSGMLNKITNTQTGMIATMYYSSTYNGTVSTTASGYLRKIVYTYAAGYTYTVTFEYNSSGKLIMAKDLTTNMAIHYTYSTAGKVSYMKQYANATETSTTATMTLGKQAHMFYSTLYSYYRTYGKDGTAGTADDIYTYYRFDYRGRVISTYTKDLNALYGAGNCIYEDDSSVKTKNSISSVMQLSGNTVNYLLNPGFEDQNPGGSEEIPKHWTISDTCYRSSEWFDVDSNDMCLYMITNSANPISCATQSFKLKVGTYTASVSFDRWYMGQNGKARLVILDSNGEEMASSDYLKPFETDRPTGNIKETKSVTFTVSDNDCVTNGWTLVIETSFINPPQANEEEWILVDDVMLEKSAGASRYSSLGNGGFEASSSSSAVTDWSLLNATQTTTSWDGKYSIKVTGNPTTQAYAYTNINFNVASNNEVTDTPESYVISGWAKADSANISYGSLDANNQYSQPVFALKAVVHYVGTTQTTTTYIPFDDHNTDWQFTTGVVYAELPDSNNKYYRISSIDVYCCYDYNINTAYFDSISVVKDANCVTHYEYNDYGYVSNVTSSDGNGVQYTYASNGVDITNATSSDGNSANMTYDSNHRLLTETNKNGPNNHKISYTYDSYGNVMSTTVSDLGASYYFMRSSTTYSTDDANFGAVLTSTDANDRISRMFYDSKARLIGTCANDGSGLIYTYDSFGRVIKISEAVYNASTNSMQTVSGGSSVSNTYNQSNLTAINTATAAYTFVYDDFGNMKQISVNSHILGLNEYASNTGNLSNTAYGNGYETSLIYDNVDRIQEICYTDSNENVTAVFTYTYNANGNLSSHTDSVNNETHVYAYDAKGNITQHSILDAETSDVKWVEHYKYDVQGRVTSVDYNYLDTTDTPTMSYYDYTYDSVGNIVNVSYGGVSAHSNYTYDSFGRLKLDVLTDTSGDELFNRENLYSSNGYATSNQIEWAFISALDGKAYDSYYEYDDVGNIALIEITDEANNLIQKNTYGYDDKNQLTREDIYIASSSSGSRTITYSYDASGNITSKKRYSHTEAENLSGLTYTETTYGYAKDVGTDNKWNDLLTSYNGSAITYDAIGNPVSYGGYTYTWTNGRQLESIYQVSPYVNTTFQYNDEGIRTVKIANGVRHEYSVTGGQINREVIYSSSGYVTKDLRYYYDASGRPVAIRAFTRTSSTAAFTENRYYLMTNMQGDVVAIYNEDGERIFEYLYDAWGNVLRSTQVATGGSAANNVNPFRYRGYYYDVETCLYYLQSRYYNPSWGRFLNADNNLSTTNLFMYCENNPIIRVDPDGEHWYYLWLDDLFEEVYNLMGCVSNIVYGGEAAKMFFTNPAGAVQLWNSRPFQDAHPSQEMQIFSEFMYSHDFVADVSVSGSIPKTNIYGKVGVSKVFSPSKDINSLYVHAGGGLSTPSVIPVTISYSFGITKGVNRPEDYARDFYDTGFSAIYGFDYCYWPGGSSAYSFTIGNSYGIYTGYDYYWCLN